MLDSFGGRGIRRLCGDPSPLRGQRRSPDVYAAAAYLTMLPIIDRTRIGAMGWRGDVLYGRNEAVDGHYILAYAEPPESAREHHTERPRRMMLWHANYHPDGGQLFFPLERRPFYVPLALPGDDVTPQRFLCFRFNGRQGLYIHPNVWHEGVFGLSGTQRFLDRQGAVHARVSVDFPREFGCLLEAPIPGDA